MRGTPLENWTPTSREIQIMGGRIGLFVEWADYIETEGGTLEEKRLEYRELLGEMAIHEEDLNGAELKHYNDLTTIAWWEHDEAVDAERELRILRDGARRLILHLLDMQETCEEEAEMSGCVSPTHPAPSPIPLGALRGGDGAGRWAGRMGARLPTEWIVLCGGVDLKAVTEGLQTEGPRSRWSDFLDPACQPIQPDTGAKFEATVSPVRFACEISLERIWNNRVTNEFLLAF